MRWFSVLTLTTLGLLSTVLADDRSDAEAGSDTLQHGLLWRVEMAGAEAGYLFGTLHSDNPAVLEMLPLVHDALVNADSVALEILMDPYSRRQFQAAMQLAHDERLSNLLSADYYRVLLDLLSNYHIPATYVDRMTPWAAMLTLSAPPSRSKHFLDVMLFHEAMNLEKPVFSLENTGEQLAVFESFTLAEQVMMLMETLDHREELIPMYDRLHELYLSHDLSVMLAYNKAQIADSKHPELAQRFNHALLTERNYRMLPRVLERFQAGNTFVAVGALHLAGPQGLLKLLEAEGYRVVSVF